MRRSLLIFILVLGTVGGYASGFHHMRYHWHAMHAARERHWAQICIDAAHQGEGKTPPPPASMPDDDEEP